MGNRTRDLPACSAVPQPTASSRARLTAGNQTIPGLSFADDLAIGLFRVNGLKIRIHHMAKFCNIWN